jgi:dynactin 1
MDHLQSDIESLESERGTLREKLKGYTNKKGDLKTTSALDITASSPYIAQELVLLKKALLDEREERMKLQATELEKKLKSMAPLHMPKNRDERIDVFDEKLKKVKYVRRNQKFEFLSNS